MGMQPGRKPSPLNKKRLANTLRSDRDGGSAAYAAHIATDVPVAPLWLTAAAKDVWADDLARVVTCGAREPDSHFYAVYCEMMARFIAGVKSGDPANAAFVSELRKQMEMLGIAGAKARLARGGDQTPASNPFAKFK